MYYPVHKKAWTDEGSFLFFPPIPRTSSGDFIESFGVSHIFIKPQILEFLLIHVSTYIISSCYNSKNSLQIELSMVNLPGKNPVTNTVNSTFVFKELVI